MSLRFGTDGVRGHADELSDQFVAALGRAAARILGGERFVIGMDTRESGPRLERALRAGLAAEGVVVEFLGVVPTPAVAAVAADERVPGAMISASHNPYHDNGIKFFAAGGLKLPDAVEAHIEAELAVVLAAEAVIVDRAEGDPVDRGRVEAYEHIVVASLEGRRLDGMRVVIDCANGAASIVAPEVLQALGAHVTTIHAEPDGRNINEGCGSNHPEDLQRVVLERGAAVGLAFDGDADRLVAVDETGSVVDGDHIIALCALDRRARGTLAHDTVVVTVMTNLGFRLAMAERGVHVVETAVGDRYVLEAMEAGGYTLGGEQSGHVIFRDLATTGDGLLTGVQLLDAVLRDERPLSTMAVEAMTRLPQVLRSVRVAHRDPAMLDALAPTIAEVEQRLGDRGRVLIRASGTEPVVRVMAEAESEAVAREAVDQLVDAVARVMGQP